MRSKLVELFQKARKPKKDETLIRLAVELKHLTGNALDAAVLVLSSDCFPKSNPIAPRSLNKGQKRKRNEKSTKSGKANKWNPTEEESRDGLLLFVEVGINILLTTCSLYDG